MNVEKAVGDQVAEGFAHHPLGLVGEGAPLRLIGVQECDSHAPLSFRDGDGGVGAVHPGDPAVQHEGFGAKGNHQLKQEVGSRLQRPLGADECSAFADVLRVVGEE